MKEVIARLRAKVHAGEPLTAAEHAAWYGSSSFSAGKRRKKKKRRKRRLPRTSSRGSSGGNLRLRVRVCRLLVRLLCHEFGGGWVFRCQVSFRVCVDIRLPQHSANSVLDCVFSWSLR